MADSHPITRFRESREPQMTQEALGSLIGVDGMTVSRWERGESLPQRRHWKLIEKATGIPISKIINAQAEAV